MTAPPDDDGSWLERWDRHWRAPHSLTALLPTSGADTRALRRQLKAREPELLGDLGGVEGLHALRVVVVPEEEGHGPRLLVNSVADGTLHQHRHRIAAVLARHLHDLVAGRPAEPDDFAAVLRAHRVGERTLFHASPGLSLREIKAEARLREVLRDWLADARRAGSLKDLEQARLAARDHVVASGDAACARGPAPAIGGQWRRRLDLLCTFLFFPLLGVLGKDIWLATRQLRPAAQRAGATVVLALWWLYAAPFTALAFLGVRLMERLEPDVEPPPASEEKLQRIEAVEDARTKNELTIWFPVKPTLAGRWLMWIVLFGAERGTRHLWTRGALAGAENIHFARLLLVDGGHRMIFMSDYEGSFDAYINHFVGVGGHTRAVIPISSRVHGCPKTRWLYFPEDTVTFRQRWRAMARSYQLQASVRYVAYPHLSANDILHHRRIRDGLFADHLSPAALEEWARGI